MLNGETLEKLIESQKNDDFTSELIADAIKSFETYHSAVYAHETTRRMLKYSFTDVAEYRNQVETFDRNRTACHNDLISKVALLNRLAEQEGLPPIYDGVVSKERPYRTQLATAVFEWVQWVMETRI